MLEVKKATKVSIRPYISGLPNAGLEKYDKVVADGAQHRDTMGFIERNGIKCYLTGLNELAPEIQNIKDPEAKEAAIVDIRKTIVFLENSIASNYNITEDDIYEKDKDGKSTDKLSNAFWSKVTMFISQGPDKFDDNRQRIPTYWDTVEVKCGNDPVTLDHKNPHDLILIKAIEAGAFDIVAPSLEAAKEAVYPPKWYLDKEDDTAVLRVTPKILRNKAAAELQRMYDRDKTKLFYVTKCCAMNSLSYRNTTPAEIQYDDCDKYINGETNEKNKKYCAEKFLEYAEMDSADLRIQAIVRDATEMNLFTFRNDGQLYYNKSGTPLGKGVMDVILTLKNPLNAEILTDITAEVEEEWGK